MSQVVAPEVCDALGERRRVEELFECADARMIEPALADPDLHDVVFKREERQVEASGGAFSRDRGAVEDGREAGGVEMSGRCRPW